MTDYEDGHTYESGDIVWGSWWWPDQRLMWRGWMPRRYATEGQVPHAWLLNQLQHPLKVNP